jgi:acetylornithine deacetylase
MKREDAECKLVELLTSLIDIPSPTGKEGEIGEYLEGLLTDMGLEVKRQELGQGRFNIEARAGEKVSVLLCTHMDTVLPHLPSSQSGETIYGRGACDAKGAIAAMISAVERVLSRGSAQPGLLFVVGEEKDSDGARKAAQLSQNVDYVVLGEPTDGKIAAGQKGAIVFRTKVAGKAAHSACPEQGSSAIHTLARLVHQWTTLDWGADPVLGPNTLNIGRIEGGVGHNVIAAEAVAEGIFRIGCSSAAVKKRLLEFETDHVSIEILSSSEPMHLHVPEEFDTTVASFGSDAPHLKSLGEIVMIGPGSIQHAHGPNEQITVDQLVSVRDQYVNLIEQLSA